MSIKSRVQRLERASDNMPDSLLFTCAFCYKDDISSWHYGGQSVTRQPGESQADLEARAREMIPAYPGRINFLIANGEM